MKSTSDVAPLELRDQWFRDLAALGCSDTSKSVAALDGVIARYAEPHRQYHSVKHVVHVLQAAGDLLAAEGVDLQGYMARTIRLALWYHDAIYEVRSGTNEHDSAVLAESDLASLGLPVHVRTDVARLIVVTKYPTIPKSLDETIVHDADLVILRAPRDVYRRYVGQVRAEYSFVADDEWAVGASAGHGGIPQCGAHLSHPNCCCRRAHCSCQHHERVFGDPARGRTRLDRHRDRCVIRARRSLRCARLEPDRVPEQVPVLAMAERGAVPRAPVTVRPKNSQLFLDAASSFWVLLPSCEQTA